VLALLACLNRSCRSIVKTLVKETCGRPKEGFTVRNRSKLFHGNSSFLVAGQLDAKHIREERMKATELLKKDHESVKKLFSEFEKAGDRAVKSKAALAEKISAELEVHATIEEEIFYPSVKAARSKEAKAIVAEAYEEHKRVKSLLQKLSKMDADDAPAYSSAMTVLKENVEHHVEEEEGEMFGDAEEYLGDKRLEELGEQLKERKAELKAQVEDDG